MTRFCDAMRQALDAGMAPADAIGKSLDSVKQRPGKRISFRGSMRDALRRGVPVRDAIAQCIEPGKLYLGVGGSHSADAKTKDNTSPLV